MQPEFINTQYAFAGYLRDPDNRPAPDNIEARRMAIYRELIYNNIENFIASGFPVLRSILADEHWHQLVRDFIRDHRCHSPYFLDISREFLHYLQETRLKEGGAQAGWEPPFMLELCHYEWVELALDVAEAEIPANGDMAPNPLHRLYQVSPLVWRLSYSYPVHKISADNQPQEPLVEGAFLVVYRNRQDKVRFLEVNHVVINLLQLIDTKEKIDGQTLLLSLAEELGYGDKSAFLDFGAGILQQLQSLDVLVALE